VTSPADVDVLIVCALADAETLSPPSADELDNPPACAAPLSKSPPATIAAEAARASPPPHTIRPAAADDELTAFAVAVPVTAAAASDFSVNVSVVLFAQQ
jgi:hypothetical protein